jgi:hypothetical protein
LRAAGLDNREVRANRIRKSVGAEKTFSSDLAEFDVMLSELQPLIDNVWCRCEDKDARGRTVTLKVKFADFELISRSRTLSAKMASRDELESVSIELLKALSPRKRQCCCSAFRFQDLQASLRTKYPCSNSSSPAVGQSKNARASSQASSTLRESISSARVRPRQG